MFRLIPVIFFLGNFFMLGKSPEPAFLSRDSVSKYKKTSDTVILTGPRIIRFTPLQDSAYIRSLRAKSLNISSDAIFYADIKLLESEILLLKKIDVITNAEILRRNTQLPVESLQPSAVEKTLYQFNIMQSQYIPFVRTYNFFGPKIPFSTIGSLLGLVEDVSPVLKYTLDYEDEVRIVIYSERAIIIRVLFEGKQYAGQYQILWDGKDNYGTQMRRGDYIGEIRIGENKLIRKRIRIE